MSAMTQLEKDLCYLNYKALKTYQLSVTIGKDAEARIEVEKKKKYDEIKSLKAQISSMESRIKQAEKEIEQLDKKQNPIKKQISDTEAIISNMNPGRILYKMTELELENTKQACLLGMIQLEEYYNPEGQNDSHRVEDITKAFVRTCEHRIKVLEEKLGPKAVWVYEGSDKADGMDVKELPEERKIRWTRTNTNNNNYASGSAKTGPFKGNRFKIQARLIQNYKNRNGWDSVFLALADPRTPVKEYYNIIYAGGYQNVWDREDPNSYHYGVYVDNPTRLNTKQITYNGNSLKRNEPIDIIYDREA